MTNFSADLSDSDSGTDSIFYDIQDSSQSTMSTPADQFNALQQLVTSLQTRIAHQDQQIQAQAQQLQAQSQSLAQITVAPASATTVPVAVTPAVKLRKP